MNVNYYELLIFAAPEAIVVLAALGALVVDLAFLRGQPARHRWLFGGIVSSLGCLLAIVWIANQHAHVDALGGMLVVNPLTQLVKELLLGLTIFTVLLSLDSDFTEHIGEYFTLVLLSTVGMMFLVSAEDVLMIFVSLELTSLSLYLLTAFNRRNMRSAEAALKYFLYGGMAAAFMVFGLSLLYGMTGETNLARIAVALAGKGLDPLLVLALVMVVAGFGFKVAAVPFHLWAPDAYQGAPIPSAALIAAGSKVASFFILAKIMMLAFKGVEGSGEWRNYASGWTSLLAVLAAASMVLGNLVAIVQGSVRRLLAYSAIAHGGYLLLAVLTNQDAALTPLIFYAATYGVTTIGAFGVVAIVEANGGDDSLSAFAGLSRRAPLPAFCLLIFLLSLAGIPPLAGFFGKFYIFTAVAGAGTHSLGLLWLVVLAIAMSAVSLYYYLLVLKQAYVLPAAAAKPLNVSPVQTLLLTLLAGLVVLLGVWPDLFLDLIQSALAATLALS